MAKKRIMVADDDPSIVDAISMMLEFEGYEPIPTVDGTIVKEMQDELPDLLLLDIWMSGEDGKDICKRLKKQESTKHIPVIMISASRDVEKSAKESGADDFIAKPFEMEVLLSKVKKYLQTK